MAIKRGIIRKGAGLAIDVVQVEKEIRAGTFTDSDREKLERILPGLYRVIKKRAEREARERGSTP